MLVKIKNGNLSFCFNSLEFPGLNNLDPSLDSPDSLVLSEY